MTEKTSKQQVKTPLLPGIQALRVRSTHPGSGPATNETYRGAFVVTPAAIQDIEKSLLLFAGTDMLSGAGVAVTAQIFQKTVPPYPTTVEDLLQHRNPKATPIYGLVFSIKTESRIATVFIDSTGMNDRAAIGLSAQVKESADADAVFSLLSAMDREAINMRDGAGHCHRRIVDTTFSWIRRHGVRIYTALFLLWLVVLLSIFVASVTQWFAHRHDHPVPAVAPQAPSPVQPDASPKAPPPSPVQVQASPRKPFDWSLIRSITVKVLIVTGAVGFLVGYGWLFPRVVFAIGDGKERFDNFKSHRRFILGSVLVCGLLLPIVRSIPIQSIEQPAKTNEKP